MESIKIWMEPDCEDLAPAQQHAGDAAYDLKSTARIVLTGESVTSIGTGLHIAIPEGYAGILKERSGLALKQSIEVHGGVIDSNYRGEVRVIIRNESTRLFTIERGDRIAQLMIVPCVSAPLEKVAELGDLGDGGDRGEAGFGSSGL